MDTTVKHDPATELCQHTLSERFGTRALGVTAQLQESFCELPRPAYGVQGGEPQLTSLWSVQQESMRSLVIVCSHVRYVQMDRLRFRKPRAA